MGRYGKKIASQRKSPEPRLCIGCQESCILRCVGKCVHSCTGTSNLKPSAERSEK